MRFDSLKILGFLVGATILPFATIASAQEGQVEERVEGTVYFATDSAQVSRRFSSLIEKTVNFLKADSRRQIVIEGHTDERASDEYNQDLSNRRSRAVVAELLAAGVSPSQVAFVGRGENEPAKKGHNLKAYRDNRRVTFCVDDVVQTDDGKSGVPEPRATEISLVPLRLLSLPGGPERFRTVQVGEARMPDFPEHSERSLQWGFDLGAALSCPGRGDSKQLNQQDRVSVSMALPGSSGFFFDFQRAV